MSTVPEVLAALATLGQATLPNSQVIDGPLGGVTTTTGRLLLIGDLEFEIQRELDALAGASATERYVVPCAIVADVPGAVQSVADAQAWADYEAIEAAIAANPSLGLSAFSLNAAVVGTQTFRRLPDENGRHSLVRFGVDTFAAND